MTTTQPIQSTSDSGTDIERLARVVTTVAVGLADHLDAPADTPMPCWLTNPDQPTMLADLTTWVHTVCRAYPDADRALPDCWSQHPWVIEELLTLMRAWVDAYRGPRACPTQVAEWHERYRPGAVDRIKRGIGRCHTTNHHTNTERSVSR